MEPAAHGGSLVGTWLRVAEACPVKGMAGRLMPLLAFGDPDTCGSVVRVAMQVGTPDEVPALRASQRRLGLLQIDLDSQIDLAVSAIQARHGGAQGALSMAAADEAGAVSLADD